MNVHELTVASQSLDEGAFLLKYPHPALIFLTEATRLEDTPAHETALDFEELHGRMRGGLRMTDQIPQPSSTSPTSAGSSIPSDAVAVTPSSAVQFLEKSNRNVFGSMITIGRATNNDIVLPLRTVSKMHAYVMAASGPTWKITDQHSANGTYLDGLRLPDGQAGNLQEGSRIGFGVETQCRFYTPPGLFALLSAYRPHVVRADP